MVGHVLALEEYKVGIEGFEHNEFENEILQKLGEDSIMRAIFPQLGGLADEIKRDYERSTKWHRRFLEMAQLVASWSKDRSTKVGAVIAKDRRVLATGYNGASTGMDDEDPDLHQKPSKYLFAEHAERNAVYQAASMGVPLKGAVIYISGPPCCDCARAIVMSGISQVYWPEDNPFEVAGEVGERWKESITASFRILKAANVTVTRIK